MKKFNVIEDNGGGLALVVFAQDGETVEYLHSGYEYNPGQLSEDLDALKAGADPALEWDNNEVDGAEIENPEDLESWFPWNQRGIGWEVVADDEEIYPEKMGYAAKEEFSIKEE